MKHPIHFTSSLIRVFPGFLLVFLFQLAYAQQPWIEVPAPHTSATRNMLRDIGGTSSSDVWTVGSFETSTPGDMKNLIMHYNGSAWHIYNGTDLSTTLNDLWGVTAITANNVWAAGSQNAYSHTKSQLLHWNGSTWSHTTTLPDNPGGNYLDGIDAISANDIWAVGGQAGSPTRPVFTIHYNGSTWSEVTAPNVGIFRNAFYDVDGIASNDVWAVGHYGDHYGDFHAMAQHWNGSTWTNIPLPSSIVTPIGELYNVTMIASNDVWALGGTVTGDLLMIHWNGSAWTTVPTAGSAGGSVAARSNGVFSVGGRISQWNGSNWTVIDSMNQIIYPNLVATVTFSNGDIWAAGISGLDGFYTLVYRSSPGQLPLAVQLKEYDVLKDGPHAMMEWSTASETNANEFVMERSQDGLNFIPVNQIPALGIAHQYQLKDLSPLPGYNYYRLKLIDQDGTITTFPIKRLKFDGSEIQPLVLYPNPAHDQVRITISDLTDEKVGVALYSSSGELVRSVQDQQVNSASIDLSVTDLPGGVYYILIEGLLKTYHAKVMVE